MDEPPRATPRNDPGSALVSALLILAATLLIRAGVRLYHAQVIEAGPDAAYREPTRLAASSEKFWRRAGLELLADAGRRRFEVRQRLTAEIARLPKGAVELSEVSPTELATRGTYGVLPEVMVDSDPGAIFPMPFPRPDRISWFQLAGECTILRHDLEVLDSAVTRWSRLDEAARIRSAGAIARAWDRSGSSLVSLSRRARYLENWVPALFTHWKRLEAQGERPTAYRLATALRAQPRGDFAGLREALRPRRLLHRAFLPETLPQAKPATARRLKHAGPSEIVVPILTDVTDERFRAELEGAVVIHWNQSPWARRHGVSLRIAWHELPRDDAFAAGRSALLEHLKRFPPAMAGLTTGSLTTQVDGNVMVLGPGRITPRTLAHEFGHLLGFPDCYLRTLSGQGAFGLAVLEWDNPAYPDDLMCDNNVGVPRDEVW